MSKTASNIIKTAQSYIGYKESNGSHKKIIDIYNSRKVLPRGYEVKYTDSWCATFISALAIKCKYTTIIPIECSCHYMIKLAKSMQIWKESDLYRAKAGDLILYDWQDNGKGDNTGVPDHIGIIEKVENDKYIVIEGNYDNEVKRRKISVNGRYIRGFIVPQYDKEVKQPKKKSITVIAKEVISGKWGNGQERKEKLEKAGYDYKKVQAKVNSLLKD